MKFNWITCTLSDIGDIIGGATPSTKKEEYYGGTISWITPKDLSSFTGRYIDQGERNITEIGLNSCSAQLMPKGTVLFTSRAPIGYVAIAKKEVCTNQGFKSVVAKDNIDPLFLYYLLVYNKDNIEALGSGTTFKEVSGKTMKTVPVIIPSSIEEQKQIATLLDKLDCRIELNNKINDNLEKQAQAIFKSWFVDFEPFGGVMPSDWELSTLGQIIEFQNGYAFKSKELLDTSFDDCYHVFKQGHINRGGGFNSNGTKSWFPVSRSVKLDKYLLRKGDVLMAMTDMKDNVAILGNTAVMPVDGTYILNQRVALLRSNSYKGTAYPYISLLTNSFDFLKDLRSRANSGVQVNLSSTEIKLSEFYLPTEKLNIEFNNIAIPMFEKMMKNDIQNQKLAQLRDTLLPRLMSGEIDVSQVEI